MNSNDIEQIILDNSPEDAAKEIWELIVSTVDRLSEIEAHRDFLVAERGWERDGGSTEPVQAAWAKYWQIKQLNDRSHLS